MKIIKFGHVFEMDNKLDKDKEVEIKIDEGKMNNIMWLDINNLKELSNHISTLINTFEQQEFKRKVDNGEIIIRPDGIIEEF